MTGRPYYVILGRIDSQLGWEYLADGEAGSPEEAVHTMLEDQQLEPDTDLKIFSVDQTDYGEPAVYRRNDLQLNV